MNIPKHKGRLDSVFYQFNLGRLHPDGTFAIDQVNFSEIASSAFANIDVDPSGFGDVAWDLQPGDCVVFNSRIRRAGSGKLDDDSELRVFTTKWLGDDVRINHRRCGMAPDHSAVMTERNLKPGDRPGTDLYPRIWSGASVGRNPVVNKC